MDTVSYVSSAPARLTRAQQREKTRQALLDAAARVFVERGFLGSSVEAISAEAGFSRGAFYSNFASKEELFAELLQARVYSVYRAMAEDMDVDCGAILDGEVTVAELGSQIFDLILEVASGRQTASEPGAAMRAASNAAGSRAAGTPHARQTTGRPRARRPSARAATNASAAADARSPPMSPAMPLHSTSTTCWATADSVSATTAAMPAVSDSPACTIAVSGGV